MRRKLCLLLLSAAACLLFAARADACSCGDTGGPCQSFGAASAVFVGTVTAEVTNNPADGARGDGWARRGFQFSVLQAFSGVRGDAVEVWTGSGGGDCGYSFSVGATYVVYAYRDVNSGRLSTNVCMRTRPVERATEDLEFLRGVHGREPGVTISGAAARVRQNLLGGDEKSQGAFAGAAVVVEGEGVRRELRTDARGQFSLSGLKPGTYKVRLELPDELTAYTPEREVRVADRGCAFVGYTVTDNGRVSGVVNDADGRPVSRVILTLYEADDPDPLKNLSRLERTDEEGRYRFDGLPPGRYRLAVNLTRFPEPGDATGAFPRAFYPGTTDGDAAEVITLGEGEHLRARDWRLPPRRTPVAVEIQIVWSDGRPVAGAHISYKDVTYHDPGLNHGARADAAGRFTLKGFEGQTYLVAARSGRDFAGDPRRDGPLEQSEPLRVTLADPAVPLKLVIHKLR